MPHLSSDPCAIGAYLFLYGCQKLQSVSQDLFERAAICMIHTLDRRRFRIFDQLEQEVSFLFRDLQIHSGLPSLITQQTAANTSNATTGLSFRRPQVQSGPVPFLYPSGFEFASASGVAGASVEPIDIVWSGHAMCPRACVSSIRWHTGCFPAQAEVHAT
jgi:hypothetical protein